MRCITLRHRSCLLSSIDVLCHGHLDRGIRSGRERARFGRRFFNRHLGDIGLAQNILFGNCCIPSHRHLWDDKLKRSLSSIVCLSNGRIPIDHVIEIVSIDLLNNRIIDGVIRSTENANQENHTICRIPKDRLHELVDIERYFTIAVLALSTNWKPMRK